MFAINRLKSFPRMSSSHRYCNVSDGKQCTDQTWKTIEFKSGLKKNKQKLFLGFQEVHWSSVSPKLLLKSWDPQMLSGHWIQFSLFASAPPILPFQCSCCHLLLLALPVNLESMQGNLLKSVKRKANAEKEPSIPSNRISQDPWLWPEARMRIVMKLRPGKRNK